MNQDELMRQQQNAINHVLGLLKPLTVKPKPIRADFSTVVGDVEVQVQGEFSAADPNVGCPAGYEIHRVWIESDLNATDLITLLTDKQIEAIQEAGVRWGEQQ